MFKRNILAAATTTIAVTILMASSAHATNLAVNTTLTPITPTVLSNLGSLVSGVAVADTGILGFSNAYETGQYEARVFKDQVAGYLDFVYDIKESTGLTGTTTLGSITMGIFTGFATDVYYVSTSSLSGTDVTTGTAGDAASRNAGDTVKFLFSTGIGVGQTGEAVVRVQAPSYTTGAYSVQNSGVSQLTGYQPTAAPEPASMAMIGAGLLALGLYRRRTA